MGERRNGFIEPRKSWPRDATPTALTPNWAGEFCSFDDWVNFASQRLTGTYEPMMGSEVSAICIDSIGRRCTMGGHFMRARDEGTFPVRFFWDCSDPTPSSTSRPGDSQTAVVGRSAFPENSGLGRSHD